MSSIICTICHELVTDVPGDLPPQQTQLEDPKILLGLSCGHIFHKFCITQWFRNRNNVDDDDGDEDEGECPCCKADVSLDEALRLFPSSERDDGPQDDKNVPPCRICQTWKMECDALKTLLENAEGLINTLRYGTALRTSKLEEVQKQLEDEKKLRSAERLNWEDIVKREQRENRALKEEVERVKDLENKKQMKILAFYKSCHDQMEEEAKKFVEEEEEDKATPAATTSQGQGHSQGQGQLQMQKSPRNLIGGGGDDNFDFSPECNCAIV